MEEMVYSETFKVTSGCFDVKDELKPYAIFDYFQEVASQHALLLNVDFETMLNKNLIWVVLKNKYVQYSFPKSITTIIVKTWPLAPGRADFDRVYQIFDTDNHLLVEGISKWCLLEVSSHSIFKCNYPIYNGQFSPQNVQVGLDRFLIMKKENMKYIYSHQVMNADLDHNNHMNNARYAEVIYNAFSDLEKRIVEMQINNLVEAKRGQQINIYLAEEGIYTYVYGFFDDDTLCFTSKIKRA